MKISPIVPKNNRARETRAKEQQSEQQSNRSTDQENKRARESDQENNRVDMLLPTAKIQHAIPF